MREWYTKSVNEVLKELGVSKNGLSENEVRKRLKKFGSNELIEKRRITPLLIFLRQFKNFFIIMLIIAGSISFVIDRMIDAAVIFLFMFIITIVGFIQEYKAEVAMRVLKSLIVPKARVVRNGVEKEIPAKHLVPGDIILLNEGDRVPADARLIDIINLKVDESSLTGESIPVTKTVSVIKETHLAERRNMVFLGTLVTAGKARAVVTETGMKTEMGSIAELVQREERITPLQTKLDNFAKWLGMFVLFLISVVFVLGITRQQPLFDMFLTSVSLAVAAVPQGLPIIITIALALGVERMVKRNCIVRKLSAVETLGSTTVICSDKTGTMTTNEMTARKIFFDNKICGVGGTGFEPEGEFYVNKKPIDLKRHESLLTLLKISALCNDAKLVKEERWKILGDPTEGALLVLSAKGGIWQDDLKKVLPRIAELPFSSERKMMTTVHSTKKTVLAFSKGAPETILENSSHMQTGSGIKKLTKKDRQRILTIVKKFASNGLRTIAFAYRKLPDSDFRSEVIEKNLVFVGLVGMIDTPRKETKEAIRLCRKAGIKVVMITGDHKDTAVAVAKEVGLLDEDDKILTGDELDKLEDIEFYEIVENISVYARVSPRHKVKILNALREKGHIVAVTGDGVNDAPALKGADIGVAMGIKGTDIAKEASDMVLIDDNFATIVNAVEEGRGIYDNIRKFIRYAVTINLSEIFFVSMTILAGLPLPLIPIQILWLNLLTDSFPALALAADPRDPEIMRRKPRNPKHSILHGMKVFLIAAGSLALATEMLIFVYELSLGSSIERARTMAFTTAIMFQLFFVFNCRSENKSVFDVGISTNKYLVGAVLLSVFLQMIVIYHPALQSIFGTVSLSLVDWMRITLLSASGLLLSPRKFLA